MPGIMIILIGLDWFMHDGYISRFFDL